MEHSRHFRDFIVKPLKERKGEREMGVVTVHPKEEYLGRLVIIKLLAIIKLITLT